MSHEHLNILKLAEYPDLNDVPTRTGMIYWYLSKHFAQDDQRNVALKVFIDSGLIPKRNAEPLSRTAGAKIYDLSSPIFGDAVSDPEIMLHFVQSFWDFVSDPFAADDVADDDPDAAERSELLEMDADDICSDHNIDELARDSRPIEEELARSSNSDFRPIAVSLARAIARAVRKRRDLYLSVGDDEFRISPPYAEISINDGRIQIGHHEFHNEKHAFRLDGNHFSADGTLIAFFDPKFRRKAALRTVNRLKKAKGGTFYVERYRSKIDDICLPDLPKNEYSERTPVRVGRDMYVPLGIFGNGFVYNGRIGATMMANGHYAFVLEENASLASDPNTEISIPLVIDTVMNFMCAETHKELVKHGIDPATVK